VSGSLTGLIAGAVLGLAAGAVNWVFFSRIEENAIKGLDRDAAEAKRSLYAKIRIGVLVTDIVAFGLVGWFVGGQFLG
jgi:hypothetical protein